MRPDLPARPSVTLHELPAPADPGGSPDSAAAVESRLAEHDRVVFVTNAVRRRGGLRSRGEQHRPVLAAVVR
jgi:hypothetical protein